MRNMLHRKTPFSLLPRVTPQEPTEQYMLVDVTELREMLRVVVREELARHNEADAAPLFVDKHSSGLGPTVFLAAARAGEFDTFRVGKGYVAREADVRAYIERQLVKQGRRTAEEAPDARAANAPVAKGRRHPAHEVRSLQRPARRSY